MPIYLPAKCLRNCDDCQPLAQIEVEGSFICIGLNDPETRKQDQDIFRHCFKNEAIDERTDWDERDIIDTVSVLMQGLSAKKNMDLNEGDS